jgi:hypothetical protein
LHLAIDYHYELTFVDVTKYELSTTFMYTGEKSHPVFLSYFFKIFAKAVMFKDLQETVPEFTKAHALDREWM